MTRARNIHVRSCGIAITLIIIAAAAALAALPAYGQVHTERDAALLDTLRTTTTSVDYRGEDLEVVVDDLREQFGLNVYVAWRQLEAIGVRPDRRITIHLNDVPLATVLDILVREAGDGPGTVSWFVAHGIVNISTDAAAGHSTVLRTYDITDLIESGYAIRRFASTPVLSLELTGREFVGGEEQEADGGFGGGGGGGLFGEPGEDPDRLTTMERIQGYVDLIREYVQPETWRTLGGEIGSMSIVDNTLVVRQTLANHERIDALLDLLRQAEPAPLDAQAVVVRMRRGEVDQWREEVGEPFPRLSTEQAQQMMDDAEAHTYLFRGTTSGLAGQRLWFSALTQRDVLMDMSPTVAEGASAFSPVSGHATQGLELIVLPLINADRETMTLDVQFAWIPPALIGERPVTLAAGAGAGDASIDQVVRRMRTVSTTAKVPLGGAIALSIPDELSDLATDETHEDWLIIHIRRAE